MYISAQGTFMVVPEGNTPVPIEGGIYDSIVTFARLVHPLKALSSMLVILVDKVTAVRPLQSLKHLFGMVVIAAGIDMLLMLEHFSNVDILPNDVIPDGMLNTPLVLLLILYFLLRREVLVIRLLVVLLVV